MKKTLILITLVLGASFFLGGCKADKKEDTLKVAIDLKFPPFMYTDESGKPAGLEVDLAYALGKYIGKKVEIVNTDFAMLIPSLETGETDIIISDMSINEARRQKLDFSIPYRYGKTLALVNKDFYRKNRITDDMPAEKFFALPDMKVIGLSGTISVSVPQRYGKDVTEITEIASGIMEITSGNYDVLVGANTIIGDHAANSDTTDIYGGLREYSQSAFAVKKGNTELVKQANNFIETLYEEGGLYEQLAEKYDPAVGEFLKDKRYGLSYIVTKPE